MIIILLKIINTILFINYFTEYLLLNVWTFNYKLFLVLIIYIFDSNIVFLDRLGQLYKKLVRNLKNAFKSIIQANKNV